MGQINKYLSVEGTFGHTKTYKDKYRNKYFEQIVRVESTLCLANTSCCCCYCCCCQFFNFAKDLVVVVFCPTEVRLSFKCLLSFCWALTSYNEEFIRFKYLSNE